MTKVLLSTGSLYHMGLERIFNIAQAAGFHDLELMMRSKNEGSSWDTWDYQYLIKIQQQYSLKIPSLHSPIDFEKNAAGYIDNTIALAQKLKVEHIVFHIPKDKDYQAEYRLWFKDNYWDYLKKSPVTFLTENMGTHCIEQGAKIYNRYPDFCFDIAHEQKNKSNLPEIISQITNIRQFHVSNFDGKQCHMSILNNKPIIQKLLKLHPDAWRVIELSPEAFGSIEADEKTIIDVLSETRSFLESF